MSIQSSEFLYSPDIWFPYSQEEELNNIHDILGARPAHVIPIGNAGYYIHNPQVPYIAEAPLILLDLDDTAIQYTAGKKECWKQLKEIGVRQETIMLCDSLARIQLGTERLYEPEVEMRLLTHALAHPEIRNEQMQMRLSLYLRQLMLPGFTHSQSVNNQVNPSI